MTSATTATRESPPYLFAALAGLAVFLIYVVTLAPTTAFWDTSEYIAAAYVLGIPHPPGNPLFTVLAHTWGALPLSPLYAVRINLFAAFTSAASAGLWFLVADRWMRDVVPVRWARLAAAFAGILVGAMAWTVWNQSTVNEKVYTVSMLSTALVMWLGVHWADDAPGQHRDRWLILIAYLIALTSTNHMMGVLAAPAVGIYVLFTEPSVLLKPWILWLGLSLALAVSGQWSIAVDGPAESRMVLGVVIAALIGYTIWRDAGEFRRPMLYLSLLAVVIGISLNYAFLPIRAHLFPPINEGEPTTWDALQQVLNRAQYGKPPVTERMSNLAWQFGNYMQYLGWQYARDWGNLGARAATALFALLGVTGAAALWQRDRRAFWASATLMFTVTLLLIFYLNFKCGFSYGEDAMKCPYGHEVRERDYFFVVSFAAFGLWIAVGFGALMQGIAEMLRSRLSETGRWVAAAPLLGLALIPIFGNRVTASRAHETLARDFARDLLESIEPYGILITAGDNDTFPLWYAQEVEGIRPDVTLANLSLMNTRWHLQQLARRQTPTFDATKAAPIWKDWKGEKPTNKVLDLTEQAINELPEAQLVPHNSGVKFGELQVAFGHDTLMLSDLISVFLIRDNIGKRPIYFAWSDGNVPDGTLGLTSYLTTEGLVRRLNPAPIKEGGQIVFNRALGFVDFERTKQLLFDTYAFDAAARVRPRGWVDRPSQSILSLYSVIYGTTAASFRQAGDTTLALRADSIARAVEANLK
jgi:uncharacterized membrane protein YoaK (UPF0700 family)